jgi:Holliday junction resolvase RusA-like endonuclease
MIKLELPLCCPLNSLYRALPFTVKGRNGSKDRTLAHQVLSKRARIKRDELVACIWKQLGGRPEAILGPISLQVMVYPRDKRTPDADAYAKHLMDILAKAGVYQNDKQVERVAFERSPQPEFPGRMVVEVWAVGEGV